MKGYKQLLLLMIISTTLTACNSSSTLPPPERLPGSWMISSIQDNPVITNSKATLVFTEENKLSGSASCNNISSSYSSQNNTLKIAPIATTRKMCAPTLMKQEATLLQSLSKVKRFQLQNGELSLFDQQGSLQLKAKRI
jgi:heat shock protein HslJ